MKNINNILVSIVTKYEIFIKAALLLYRYEFLKSIISCKINIYQKKKLHVHNLAHGIWFDMLHNQLKLKTYRNMEFTQKSKIITHKKSKH